MIKFDITQEDLSCLGYPKDMKIEMYLRYHDWVKEGKNPLEFKCTLERSFEYVDDFNKKWYVFFNENL